MARIKTIIYLDEAIDMQLRHIAAIAATKKSRLIETAARIAINAIITGQLDEEAWKKLMEIRRRYQEKQAILQARRVRLEA